MCRVCVALSRARDGLLILGNLPLLASRAPFWGRIQQILEHRGRIVSSVPLQCQTHGTVVRIRHKGDFQQVLNGGCATVCSTSMACGHKCVEKCHGMTFRHRCGEICPRVCAKGHKCSKPCQEICGNCEQRKQNKRR